MQSGTTNSHFHTTDVNRYITPTKTAQKHEMAANEYVKYANEALFTGK